MPGRALQTRRSAEMWIKHVLRIAGGAVALYALCRFITDRNVLRKSSKRIFRKNPSFQIQEQMTEKRGFLKIRTAGGFRDVYVDIGWEEGSKAALIVIYEDAAMKTEVERVSLARCSLQVC